ncbi:4-oxalocrotonate tautomerase family protein [Cyanobium gracile]|uniref:4-oxalocrotonate tautomerase family protein n=1 Tax=Cyanobium gracile UHCC 0281 TaxID=3110309 RepID=A0ABU5SY61_9CYAN|nr:4-oxalocrotonate tautomerase family protein [Cyanobium gracile]MEA5443467.1 4-oxalocrotonate tautomerase family protein [Cyanobium gracile UHCC 0281]
MNSQQAKEPPTPGASPLPYVNVQITRGASRQQKAEIVKDITDSLVRVLDKKPEHTHVVIQEIDDENWGFSGMLTDDWKVAQAGTSSDER